jgi:hypothetical protein
MSRSIVRSALILMLLSDTTLALAQAAAPPDAAANTTAAVAADTTTPVPTGTVETAAPAPVTADTAAAAPPAPDSFGSDRLFVKLGGGGGMAIQGKLEDTTANYKRWAEANGWGLTAEVSRACFAGEMEVGYLVNPKWGFSFEAEVLFPGKFKAEAVEGDRTYTQEIGQMIVPASLNVYSYIPQGKRRFFVTAGGGVMLSSLTFDETDSAGPARSADFSGVGPCIRLGAGHQWLMGSNVLEVGLRGLWGSVSRFTGSVTDEDGTYDAAMVQDADGLLYYEPKAAVGIDGREYLKMGLLDLGLRAGFSILF